MKLFNCITAAICTAIMATGCHMGKDQDTGAAAPAATITDSATGNVIDSSSVYNQPSDHTATMPDTLHQPTNTAGGATGKKKAKVTVAMPSSSAANAAATPDKEGYYTDVYPSYPGGNGAIENFFANNIEYPQDAIDNSVEGTVNISFTVDEKGKVGSPKVTSQPLGHGIEQEALRVFAKMPQWKPGNLKGKNVKTRYNLPVRFQLE